MADQTVTSRKRKTEPIETQPTTKLRRSRRIQNTQLLSTGLNFDCLEQICQYLDLHDLFAVAQISKELQVAAQYIYKKKYRHLSQSVICNVTKCPTRFHKIATKQKSLEIYNPITMRAFLWCFGKFILELEVRLSGEKQVDKYSADIIKDASKYCTKLKKLYISSKQSNILDVVNSPFLEVEELMLWNVGITRHRSRSERLRWLFPNLQRLICTDDDLKCIQHHFPELKWLDVRELRTNHCADILNCISLNPQLRKLTVHLRKFVIDYAHSDWVSFLVKIETLIRIRLSCLNIYFERLKREHGHEWQIERKRSSIVMQRK